MTGPAQPQTEGAEIISQNCRGEHTGHQYIWMVRDPDSITLGSVYLKLYLHVMPSLSINLHIICVIFWVVVSGVVAYITHILPNKTKQ